jgi:hypothetical protein
VRQLSGVERLNNPSSMTGAIVPGLLGAGAAILGAIGVRQFVEPTADNQKIVDNADWIGLGLGGLVGLALWNMASKPAGVAAMVAATGVTLASRLPSMLSGGALAPMPAGTGAIVAQTMNGMRRRGTGAIVMQPASVGGYGPGGGETVSLQGLRAINPSAFGTPSFRMSR